MSLMLDWIIIRIICFIIVVFLSIDVNLNDFCCVNQKEKKEKENMIKVYCKIWYLWEIVFTPSFFILFIYLFFLVIIGLNLELGVDHWLHDQLCNRQSNITHSVARRGTSTIIVIFQRLEYWTNGLFVILSCFDYAWLLGGAIDGIIHGLVKDLIR